jgi:hypothetical protein
MVGTFVIASGKKIPSECNGLVPACRPGIAWRPDVCTEAIHGGTRQYSHPVTGICGHRITVCLQYGAAVVIEKAGVAGTRSWLLANIAMLGYLPRWACAWCCRWYSAWC